MVNKTFSWTCPKCGMVIPQNAVHNCGNLPLEYPATQFVNLDLKNLEQRIADLERRIAALEQRVQEDK